MQNVLNFSLPAVLIIAELLLRELSGADTQGVVAPSIAVAAVALVVSVVVPEKQFQEIDGRRMVIGSVGGSRYSIFVAVVAIGYGLLWMFIASKTVLFIEKKIICCHIFQYNISLTIISVIMYSFAIAVVMLRRLWR